MGTTSLSGGFADPVIEAQGVFRALVQALARPGRAQGLDVALVPPPPLSAELAAVALTLVDHETPIWLAGPLQGSAEVRRWLAFHTGARVVHAPDEAGFVFAPDIASLPPLSSFRRGTAEYPDGGATVVVGVPSLDGGLPVRLAGPGIEHARDFAPAGMSPGWWAELMATRAAFPLGIDVILASPGRVAGLPRSTRIEIPEETPCMSR